VTRIREHSLSLFFGAIFLVTVVAQSFAGHLSHNAEEVDRGASPVSWWSYVTSTDFWGAVMENWLDLVSHGPQLAGTRRAVLDGTRERCDRGRREWPRNRDRA
jgi:hypothetical protein